MFKDILYPILRSVQNQTLDGCIMYLTDTLVFYVSILFVLKIIRFTTCMDVISPNLLYHCMTDFYIFVIFSFLYGCPF